MIPIQFTLLTVAWIHACIGLYFWLRLRPWFRWAGPILLAAAVLLPPLSVLGADQGAREVVALAKDPQWRAQQYTSAASSAAYDGRHHYAVLLSNRLRRRHRAGFRGARRARARSVCSRHDDQLDLNQQVRVPKGMSVLEASLRFKVPHASVCGGRARCSTCRVRVVSDRTALPRPSGREAFVLARVGANHDPSIRLACQLRPQTDVAVIPVLPPHVGADSAAQPPPHQYRRRALRGEHVYRYARFDQAH